jgi:hydrogenase maturation protease
MAKEAVENAYTAPILVLSLGQVERETESFGPRVLDELTERYRYAGGFVEFVDGGSDGLELLHLFARRKVILVLDAIRTFQRGAVNVLEGNEALRYANGDSPETHPGDVHELLSTAAFLGELPEHFYIIGVEPHRSDAIAQQLQAATEQAQGIVDRWLVELAEPVLA